MENSNRFFLFIFIIFFTYLFLDEKKISSHSWDVEKKTSFHNFQVYSGKKKGPKHVKKKNFERKVPK